MGQSYNQQQMYGWVGSHIRLPLVQHQVYTDWYLHEACEIRIINKACYYKLLEEIRVTKCTICHTINVIFTPLECSSLKHLWDLIGLCKINKKIFIEVIMITVVNKNYGRGTYPLKGEGAYIVTTTEMYVSNILPRDSISLARRVPRNCVTKTDIFGSLHRIYILSF